MMDFSESVKRVEAKESDYSINRIDKVVVKTLDGEQKDFVASNSSEELEVKIRYISSTIPHLEKIDVGDWIDLYAAKDVKLEAGDFTLIPLGVAMKLPEGYEAIIAPRSSTFKKYGIIQTNSIGVIDNSYCGNNDQWMLAVYATRDIRIPANARICQFRIQKRQPEIRFVECDDLGSVDRGGFGSTGV